VSFALNVIGLLHDLMSLICFACYRAWQFSRRISHISFPRCEK